MEEWRDIKDFQNYQVSSQGRVRSLDHEVEARVCGGVVKKHYKGKVLKSSENTWGYPSVGLFKDGKMYTKTIHRLVAQTFIPNSEDLPAVNHKDEDKHNNRVENLEWCTNEYNTNFGSRNDRIAKTQSKPVGQFTLDGKLIKVWQSAAEAGRNGFCNVSVSQCCLGKQKTHKSYTWKYL